MIDLLLTLYDTLSEPIIISYTVLCCWGVWYFLS